MKIYTIKQPFMSREGQFEPGKHTLTVGLAEKALQSYKIYRLTIGEAHITWYEIDTHSALVWASEHDSWWVSPHTGARTAILPIFLFKSHKFREGAKDAFNEQKPVETGQRPLL
jgi:hypothetical protein